MMKVKKEKDKSHLPKEQDSRQQVTGCKQMKNF